MNTEKREEIPMPYTTIRPRTLRRRLILVGLGGVLAAAALAPAPHADAFLDPHVPVPIIGYCPGGGNGGGLGYCDGRAYPDGSYWHQLRLWAPFVGVQWNVSCVVPADPIPALAAPGQCGGAW